jgi:hypothetical protein
VLGVALDLGRAGARRPRVQGRERELADPREQPEAEGLVGATTRTRCVSACIDIAISSADDQKRG